MLISLLITQSMIDATLIGLIVLILIGVGCYFIFLLFLKDEFFIKNLKGVLNKRGA